jgi:hypothetical protein
MNCPRCGLINPETAQRCDCGYDFISESVEKTHSTSSPNTPLSRIAIGAQVVALVLAGGAVIWGCCMVHIALHPGASGEFGGYSVLFAAVVDMPVGLVSLVVGLAVKKGHPALRWTCLVLSVVALALPFLTKAAWQSQFIRVK